LPELFRQSAEFAAGLGFAQRIFSAISSKRVGQILRWARRRIKPKEVSHPLLKERFEMIAKLALRALALLIAVVVATTAAQALAYCSSCSGGAPAAYSAGYAAPVSYTAAYAAPVAYTTAYAPAYTTYNSGWYPGRFFDRRRSVWGYPTTASYAPTYTAAYAPTYTAAYAPVYTTA
jgi:hypothetical protein